ncbi:MAG: hypothetical protein PVI06_04945 [Desulfobacterales bacterium]
MKNAEQVREVLQRAKQIAYRNPAAAIKLLRRQRTSETFQKMTKIGGELHDEFRKVILLLWSLGRSREIPPKLPSVAMVPWQHVKSLQDLFYAANTIEEDIVYLVSSHPMFDADALTQLDFLRQLADFRVVMVIGRLTDRWLGPVLIRKSFIRMAGQSLKPSKKEMLRELLGFAKNQGFTVKG